MLRKLTGAFLVAIILAVAVGDSASVSVSCLEPTPACRSVDSGSCCDSAPSDCCLVVPEEGNFFVVAPGFKVDSPRFLTEVESPSSLFLNTVSLTESCGRFHSPDPPPRTGRVLLIFVQRSLV